MWMKRNVNVALVFVLLSLGAFVEGGTVDISAVNSPDDLDLSGKVIYAINFGDNGNPKFGDFVFSQDQDYPGISVVKSDEGTVTKWGGGAVYPGTGNTELDKLLGGVVVKWWDSWSPDCTTYVNAPGLKVGTSYMLQIICYEPMHGGRFFDFVVEGQTVAANIESLSQQGGVLGKGGFLVKYVFTATDSILNIAMAPVPNDGSTASGLAGFVLTEIPVLPGPVDISPVNSPDDLDLSGEVIYAINFGNNGNPTFGDFVFSQDQDYPEVICSRTAEGVATIWGAPYPNTGYPELDKLLVGLVWTNNSGTGLTTSISAGGLVVGVCYQLQLVFYTNGTRPMNIVVEGEMIVQHDPYPIQMSVVPPGGSIVKYVFTASDNTLNIDITSVTFDIASAISAFIVTELVPVPDPDLNEDGIVDFKDFSRLAQYWLQEEPSVDLGPRPCGDHIVDMQDLAVLAEYWLKEVPPAGLIAYWKLDETEGSIAYDIAGNNDGTLNGGPIWHPAGGKIKGALEFDGVDDYVITPFVLNPDIGAFSVFASIKGGAPGQVIISQSTGSGAEWLCMDSSYGKLSTKLTDGNRTTRPLVSEFVITDGEWHQVGVVWDGSKRHLYADNQEVAVDSSTLNNLVSCDGGLYIGAGETLAASEFWSGLIDDVRIMIGP